MILRKTDAIAALQGNRQYQNEVVEPVPLVEKEYEQQGYLLHEFYKNLWKNTHHDLSRQYQIVSDGVGCD